MKSFIKEHSYYYYDALTIFFMNFFYQDSVEITVEVKKKNFSWQRKGTRILPQKIFHSIVDVYDILQPSCKTFKAKSLLMLLFGPFKSNFLHFTHFKIDDLSYAYL